MDCHSIDKTVSEMDTAAAAAAPPAAAVMHTLGDLHLDYVTSEADADRVWEQFVACTRAVLCANDALVAFASDDARFATDAVVLQASQRALLGIADELKAHMAALQRVHLACLAQQRELARRTSELVVYSISAALSRRAPEEPGDEAGMFRVPPIDRANPALGGAANNVRDDGPPNARIGTTFG
jgi:hypothetical protein